MRPRSLIKVLHLAWLHFSHTKLESYIVKRVIWSNLSFPGVGYFDHLNGPLIGLVTVFDAILTSRQTREKLQCLYENPMSNNFRKTAVLKKI